MKTVAASVLIAIVCLLVVAEGELPQPRALPPPVTLHTAPQTPPKSSSTTTPKPIVDKFCSKLEANSKPYSTLCKAPSIHTLIQYSSSTWSVACQPAYTAQSTVSATDIANILKKHNLIRQRIAKGLEPIGEPAGPQPKASNMKEMKWDDELACIANAWAHQCVYKHDQCRDVPRFKVGQNIFIAVSPSNTLGTADWTPPFAGWYSEVQYMNPAYVSSFPASSPYNISEYTQVVWANTYLVGCATAYYKSTALYGTRFPYNRIYVCNYGPTGNVVGSPIYAQGATGSACPAGPSSNYPGLCA